MVLSNGKKGGKVVLFTTPVPVGMKNVPIKMESAQNRLYRSLPIAIKEGFGITCKGDYNPEDYTVSVSFGRDGMHSKFLLPFMFQ